MDGLDGILGRGLRSLASGGTGPAAARLAGRLGPGWAIQDFRALSPSPPPQTLELWLPDR